LPPFDPPVIEEIFSPLKDKAAKEPFLTVRERTSGSGMAISKIPAAVLSAVTIPGCPVASKKETGRRILESPG